MGFPGGPDTWEDLLAGGRKIREKFGNPVGIGFSQEMDSNMALRALLWSFGGAEQDERGLPALASKETVEALKFARALYREAGAPEVFTWDPSSNNRAILSGRASFVQNAISVTRSAEKENPEMARKIGLTPALRGPVRRIAAEHLMSCYVIWKFAENPDAARQFLVDLVGSFADVFRESEFYSFPCYPATVPDLAARIAADPAAQPPGKYAVLATALDWSTNVGFPGYATAAMDEVFNTFVIPTMFARVARGESTPEEAALAAERRVPADLRPLEPPRVGAAHAEVRRSLFRRLGGLRALSAGLPERLFAHLAARAPGRRRAWDCATGNGQAARSLARHFDEVIATDASAEADRARAPAAARGLPRRAGGGLGPAGGIDGSRHRRTGPASPFDRPRFWTEARTRPGRARSHRRLVLRSVVDQRGHRRRHRSALPRHCGTLLAARAGADGTAVPDDRRFPSPKRRRRPFRMEKRWSLPELVGYLRTWSAARRYQEAHGEDPIGLVLPELENAWGTRARPQRSLGPRPADRAKNVESPGDRPGRASTGRCAACASRSPTAATCAASYCMPEADYIWLPREDILDFEEIAVLADVFSSLGVDRVRLTGGEPLLRRDLPNLIELLAARPAIRDLALTTNGVLLAEPGGRPARRRPAPPHRQPRHAAAGSVRGAHAPRRAAARCSPASTPRPRAGFAAAQDRHGRPPRAQRRRAAGAAGVRQDGRRRGAVHRVHGRRRRDALVDGRRWSRARRSWRASRGATGRSRRCPGGTRLPPSASACPTGRRFGIIASTTEPFCAACDRSRLTADGLWLLCLYAHGGLDLRHPLREGATG